MIDILWYCSVGSLCVLSWDGFVEWTFESQHVGHRSLYIFQVFTFVLCTLESIIVHRCYLGKSPTSALSVARVIIARVFACLTTISLQLALEVDNVSGTTCANTSPHICMCLLDLSICTAAVYTAFLGRTALHCNPWLTWFGWWFVGLELLFRIEGTFQNSGIGRI